MKLTVPLAGQTFLGDAYLTAAVTYLRLEAQNLRAPNAGNQDQVIGTLGISFLK